METNKKIRSNNREIHMGINKERLMEKQEKNTELIKRTEVKDTPFTIITIDGKSFGTMGKYRITEEYKTIASVRLNLQKVTWNRIIQVIILMQEQTEEIKKIKK